MCRGGCSFFPLLWVARKPLVPHLLTPNWLTLNIMMGVMVMRRRGHDEKALTIFEIWWLELGLPQSFVVRQFFGTHSYIIRSLRLWFSLPTSWVWNISYASLIKILGQKGGLNFGLLGCEKSLSLTRKKDYWNDPVKRGWWRPGSQILFYIGNS